MSAFDPKMFAMQTFEGANSTESIPHPTGDQWVGLVDKVEITAWQKKDDPTKGGLKMTAIIVTEDPDVAKITGRPKNKLSYEAMLDLDDNGMLDMSKGMNVRLGQFRAAIGLNDGGPWNFDMMAGRTIGYKVKHEPYEGRLLAKITEVRKP